jgi:hypothetical protein
MHIHIQPSYIPTCFVGGCPPSSKKTKPQTKTHRCLEVFFSSCTHRFISRNPSTQSCLCHTSHVCMVCGVFSLMTEVAVTDTRRKISCLYRCLYIIRSFGGRQFGVGHVFFIWKTSTPLLSNARELSLTYLYIRYDLGNDLTTIICTIRPVYRYLLHSSWISDLHSFAFRRLIEVWILVSVTNNFVKQTTNTHVLTPGFQVIFICRLFVNVYYNTTARLQSPLPFLQIILMSFIRSFVTFCTFHNKTFLIKRYLLFRS